MDYDELVAKVIELLQREKRIPYRSLKRRFELDDDYIEDLKIDLIEAKRLAVDENDRILVWIGDVQAVTSEVAQATQPLAAQQQPSPEVTPRISAAPPDAELPALRGRSPMEARECAARAEHWLPGALPRRVGAVRPIALPGAGFVPYAGAVPDGGRHGLRRRGPSQAPIV